MPQFSTELIGRGTVLGPESGIRAGRSAARHELDLYVSVPKVIEETVSNKLEGAEAEKVLRVQRNTAT